MLKVILGLTVGIILVLAGRANADIVRQQMPCDSTCTTLPPGDTGSFTARSVTFAAPGRGKLVVSFHGFLYCINNGAASANFITDTQIVEGNAEPNAVGPSGLEYYGTVPGGGGIATFNLASHRVFTITGAGTHTYRFRLTRNLVPISSACSVYNGTFTTDFRE